MKRLGLTPLLVLAAIATAMLVAAKYAPYFPGDVPLSRAIQSRAPAGDWARAVTRAAYTPWIFGVLAASALAALRVAGWRGALAVAVTMFVFMHGEHSIKDLIARPRPSADLVRTSGSPMPMMTGMATTPSPTGGYSMPSGWALLFGSTVGVLGMLAWRNTRGGVRAVYAAGCALVLLAGLLARVSLGAHWPSDMIAGYLLAITVGLALYELLTTLKGKGQRTKGRVTSPALSRKSGARQSLRPTR